MTDFLVARPAPIAKAIASIDRQVRWFIGISLVLGISGLAVGAWGLLQFSADADELPDLGAFLAGTVAPLWSAAGLVLIYVAFLGQRRQILHQEEAIELNRVELSQTRDELRGQKEQLALQRQEMQLQNRLASKQGFEATFFELLRFHRDAVTMLRANPGGGGYADGQVAFRQAAAELEMRLRPTPDMAAAKGRDQLEAAYVWKNNQLNEVFPAICLSVTSDFGHYFRTLYHLIKLIHESEPTDKQRYASLARAQMSNAELLLLMVNGLASVGKEKFKPLIERYALLEPIRLEGSYDEYKQFYGYKAFGDRWAALSSR